MLDKQPTIIGQNNTQEIGGLENSLVISVTNKIKRLTEVVKGKLNTEKCNLKQMQLMLFNYKKY